MFAEVFTYSLLLLAGQVSSSPIYGRAPNTSTLIKVQQDMPASALPTTTLSLKHVLLGVGTQNYTCTASSADVAPSAVGAKAELFDLSNYFAKQSSSKLKELIPTVPPLALSLSQKPRQLHQYLQSNGIPCAGHHFFTSAAVPTFSLLYAHPSAQLNAKKEANVTAPATSFTGLHNEGAVDWLFLDDAGGSYGGVSAVYRLETAGGKQSKTCDGQPVNQIITVEYSAEYWMYG